MTDQQTHVSMRIAGAHVGSRQRDLTPGRLLLYMALITLSFFMLAPLFWMVFAAFKTEKDMFAYTFMPYGDARLTAQNFRDLFENFHFGRSLLNSFFLTCTATTVSLLLASLGGFALAKYEFKGKQPLMAVMLATMMIPSSVLLAPSYELLVHLGLMNSYWGILLPGAVGAFGMMLFRQAILSVPDDLIEAARLDGCSEFGIYWNIIMPVVRPMSGAFCLMAFMANWNNFLMPMIVLQSEALFTVPIALSQTIGLVGDNQYGLLMAGTLLGVLPPSILFFILQKEFIAGLTSGAVKG